MIEYIRCCDSTQAELERRYLNEEAKIGNFLLCKTQTKGNGRFGRSFFSPEGGLYMSTIQSYDPERDMVIESALLAKRAIEEFFDICCDFKPVNDIYLNGRKICGTIGKAIPETENNAKSPHFALQHPKSSIVYNVCIIGIGINVFEPLSGWPPELKEKAGSIFSGKESLDFSPGKKQAVINRLASMLEEKITKDLCSQRI